MTVGGPDALSPVAQSGEGDVVEITELAAGKAALPPEGDIAASVGERHAVREWQGDDVFHDYLRLKNQ